MCGANDDRSHTEIPDTLRNSLHLCNNMKYVHLNGNNCFAKEVLAEFLECLLILVDNGLPVLDEVFQGTFP